MEPPEKGTRILMIAPTHVKQGTELIIRATPRS